MRYLPTIAAIAGSLCLSGCGSDRVGRAALDEAYRHFIPADTKVLARIDVEKLKSTALYLRHEKDLHFPMLDGSSERLGLDPRRDVSDVLIAWNGKRQLVLVRGRFKPADVEQKLASLHVGRTTYKTHAVFGDDKNSVAFLNPSLAVEGSPGDVQRALDLKDSSANTVPDELEARLRQLPKDDQIWIVSRGGLPFADVPMRSDYESALSNIVNFVNGATVAVKADSGAHFQMDISCISGQGAQRIHDALRGGIGLARLATKDNENELLQVYDAIQVDQDKEAVHVRADYSGELSDKVFSEIRQFNISKR